MSIKSEVAMAAIMSTNMTLRQRQHLFWVLQAQQAMIETSRKMPKPIAPIIIKALKAPAALAAGLIPM